MQPASIAHRTDSLTGSFGDIARKSQGYRGYTGSRRGNAQRGRLELAGFFLLLRAVDFLVYFSTPVDERSRVLAALFTCALWTTAPLVGVWLRTGWCRWAMMACLFGSVAAMSYVLRSSFDLPIQYSHFVMPFIIAIVNAGIAWAVIGLRDIRRLVSRSHTSRPYGYR